MARTGGIDWKIVKTQWFTADVAKSLDPVARRVLSRFGWKVMRAARDSIRVAPQRPKKSLTKPQLRRLEAATARYKNGDGPKPRRPLRRSKPGQPPYRRWSKSPIRLIFFAYDPVEKSVTVGPVAFRGRDNSPGAVTEALEYGGPTRGRLGRRVLVAARPYMQPAFNKNKEILRDLKGK